MFRYVPEPIKDTSVCVCVGRGGEGKKRERGGGEWKDFLEYLVRVFAQFSKS